MGVTARKIVQGELDFSTKDNSRQEQAILQLGWTHQKDDGLVFIAIKPGGVSENWSQCHLYQYELEKVTRFLEIQNVYISQSSFSCPQRTVSRLHRLNTLFVDLDYHHVKELACLSKEQIVWMLEEEFFIHLVPTPSIIISTGEGLALIWMIEPETSEALPQWQTIEDYLVGQLSVCGADPVARDAARVIRLAGTFNSDNGALAQIIRIYDLNYRYSLDQIKQDYLPELNSEKQAPGRPQNVRKKISGLYTIYKLNFTRIKDLETLQAMRTLAGDTCVHYREIMCFLYRYWVCCFTSNPEESLKEALEFNVRFLKPLSEKEVVSATKSAEKGWQEWLTNYDSEGNFVGNSDGNHKFAGYNYTNRELIRLLSITSEEQKEMDTIISKKEKYRRNNERRYNQKRDSEGLTTKQRDVVNANP